MPGTTNKSKLDSSYVLLGKILTRYSIIILLTVTILAVTFTWIGLARHGFPEFGDPYLGFQTRFTPISNRLVTLQNFRTELNHLTVLENYPGERIGEKELRKRRNSKSNSMCSTYPLDEYGRVGLELKGYASSPVLKRETLSLICYFQQLISTIPQYHLVCEVNEDRQCCGIWSLPNYVAQYSNKSDCLDIQEDDVDRFSKGLHLCHNFYSNSTQHEECQFQRSTCPQQCHYGQILQSAYSHTIERDSFQKNASQYSMIILPVPRTAKDQTKMESFQKQIWDLRKSLPQDLVTVAGFDLGGKNAIFETYLVSDLQYVGLASVIIFSIVLIFTKSFFVTVISFGMLLLSLGISYYVYHSIFLIPYFPFMNMLVTIIILGIGTDATLIVSSAWERASSACAGVGNKRAQRELIMAQTLAETTATLAITTCTTAGAFFASLMSSITTIRCFSIFAGTAIITSFILLYICVPISLDCSSRFWNYFKSLFPPPEQNKLFTKIVSSSAKLSTLCSIPVTSSKYFKNLTSSTIFWTCSFFICGIALLTSIVFVFYSPGLKLPDSEQFQLLSASHPSEIYDRLLSPAFGEITTQDESKLTLYFIWGLRPVDTGNGLDPMNTGKLEFYPEFSLDAPESQKWMKRLCRKIQKLRFYDPVENIRIGLNLDACFMDTFVSWMRRDSGQYAGKQEANSSCCCNSSKFPYSQQTLHQCIGLAARDVYRTPSFYFLTDIAGPKFFLTHGGNVTEDENKLATFTIRIRTNVTYSMAYDKMDKTYREFEKSFDELLKDAPPALQHGFFVSSHFDFYDLQKSLIEETWTSLLLSIGLCFSFLWIASRSVTIALGAAISIFTIVTSGIMIQFFSWKLGVFESIAATVAVGLSDFTAHHAIEFAKKNSIGKITLPTFFSAISTVVMGLCLYVFSSVLVYEQIGSFFFILVITSWIYSVFFLTPVLQTISKIVQVILGAKAQAQVTSSSDDDDTHSHSDLIVENVTVTQIPRPSDKRPNQAMMEKLKQLKKVGQETPV